VKTTATAIGALCLALLGSRSAQAHVSLHPNTIPAGAFVTLNVRVPSEREGADTYKLATLIPPGFTEVDTQAVPGWSVKKITRKLATPIQTDDGPVDEEVSQIIWTGDHSPLGRLRNGQFIQFPLSIAMPSDVAAGQSLQFKTLQYYSDGTVVRWIGPPSAEYPAPTVNVTPKGGAIEDVAGGEAGPAPGQTPSGQGDTGSGSGSSSATTTNGGAGKGLALAALIVGALGLLAGIGALLTARRRSEAPR
jgi:uncharacterized protein